MALTVEDKLGIYSKGVHLTMDKMSKAIMAGNWKDFVDEIPEVGRFVDAAQETCAVLVGDERDECFDKVDAMLKDTQQTMEEEFSDAIIKYCEKTEASA